MRRVRKPTIFGAWMFWWPAFALALGGVTASVYAPASPFVGLFGGLACAIWLYLWRRQRYVRWLNGDDIRPSSSTAAPTTPAR